MKIECFLLLERERERGDRGAFVEVWELARANREQGLEGWQGEESFLPSRGLDDM